MRVWLLHDGPETSAACAAMMSIARLRVESDKRQAVDHRLDQLGTVPHDVAQLIERYVGSARLGVLQADSLLNTLGTGTPSAPPPWAAPPRPISSVPAVRESVLPEEEESRVVSLSDAAPAFDADVETDGPPMQRMDARLARQLSTRKNTPFPGGIAGAEDMPAFAPRRAFTPRPFNVPEPLGSARPTLPSLIPPLPAAARLPEPPPSEESQALAGLGSEEPPSASVELTKPASEDDFEIIVDDEIVEIEAGDVLSEPPDAS
jgi:hypothetical protein